MSYHLNVMYLNKRISGTNSLAGKKKKMLCWWILFWPESQKVNFGDVGNARLLSPILILPSLHYKWTAASPFVPVIAVNTSCSFVTI